MPHRFAFSRVLVSNQVAQGVGIRAHQLSVEVALANATQFQLQMRNLLTVAEAGYNLWFWGRSARQYEEPYVSLSRRF